MIHSQAIGGRAALASVPLVMPVPRRPLLHEMQNLHRKFDSHPGDIGSENTTQSPHPSPTTHRPGIPYFLKDRRAGMPRYTVRQSLVLQCI